MLNNKFFLFAVCLFCVAQPPEARATEVVKARHLLEAVGSTEAATQPDGHDALVEIKQIKTPQMDYFLLAYPEVISGERLRMILALHPAGVSAEDYLESWELQAIKRRTMIFAPQRKSIYEMDGPEINGMIKLIEEICSRYPVDRKRVYIVGTSAGALVGTWLVQRNPVMWRGAVSIAGFGVEDALVGTPLNQVKYELYPAMLYVHGGRDHATFKGVLSGIETLIDHGVSVQLYSYEDAGHEHRPEWNQRIFEWIEKVESQSQSLNNTPKAA